MARLYALAGRVHAHPAVRTAFKDYILATGSGIVKDEEKVGGSWVAAGCSWVAGGRACVEGRHSRPPVFDQRGWDCERW